jgi:hypothetical protein
MFGNRKRKPEEEDDPLVPHGLVWHAIEASANQQPSEPAPEATKVVEITRTTPGPQPPLKQSAPPVPQTPVSTAPPSAVPPPREAQKLESKLPDRSPRKLPVAFESAAIHPPESSVPPPPRPVLLTENYRRPAPAKRSPRPQTVRMGPRLSSVSPGIRRLRGRIVREWCSALSVFAGAARRCFGSLKALNLRAQIAGAGSFAASILRVRGRRARVYVSQGLEVSKARVTELTRAVESRLRANSSAWRSSPLPRPIRPRLRVRLTGLPLKARILLARKVSESRLRQAALRDPRLWTSMTLAAITALLVLAIVSLAPRYAEKSLPSRILTSNSTVHANAVGRTALPTQPQSEKRRALPSKAKRQALASQSAAAHRRHHANDDEDYVAPDSYTDYRTNARTSR